MIKVKASDIKTGSVLDEELHWSARREGNPIFEKSFINRDEAMAYCISMVEDHPDVAFWIYEGNLEPERVVNQKAADKLIDNSEADLIKKLWQLFSLLRWLVGLNPP